MLLVVGIGLAPGVGFRMGVCSWVNHVPGETEKLVVMGGDSFRCRSTGINGG